MSTASRCAVPAHYTPEAGIEAWVEPDNTGSQRVLKMKGYLLEGKLRSFLTFGARRADVLVYSRIAADATASGGLR